MVPQLGLPGLPPGPLSHLIVNRAKRTVPYPILGENTMVLSDTLCVAPNDKGELCLTCRCAGALRRVSTCPAYEIDECP